MEADRNVMHYALGDKQDYEYEWSKAVLEYLENEYFSENNKSKIEVENTTYNILKREKVTVFYDTDGNTLFDVENDRLKEEYENMEDVENDIEPKSEIGKTISSIEKKALNQAVNNEINAKKEEKMDQKSSVYIGVVGAVTKLQEELKKAKDKAFAKPVIEHLTERCQESESLASDVCQDHKTWEKCYKYIYEQARKQAKGSSCAVRDDVVYEWAEDYYHKDDKAEEEKKKKQEEKSKADNKMETPKTSVKKEKKSETLKSEPKPKKNNKDMDGQIDMFSLLGM